VTHWIITNRPFRPGVDPSDPRARVTGTDILDAHDQHDRIGGLPVFRVARFEPDGLPLNPTDEQLKRAVRFTPDAFVGDYARLREDVPALASGRGADVRGLPGTLQMFADLYRAMSRAPEGQGDALVFLHGYNYTWSDSLRHLLSLVRVYAEPEASPVSHLVYFSWPSWGQRGRYFSDQEIAQPAGLNFGRLFGKVVQFYREAFVPRRGEAESTDPLGFCGRRLHLAAHSMGAQVLEPFVRSIVGVPSLRVPIFSQALLLNADLDWTALEAGRPLHDLPSYADRIHVYNHRDDDALLISEATKNSERRLGRHGPRTMADGVISDRTIVVDCTRLHLARTARAKREPALSDAARVATTAASNRFFETAERVLQGSDRTRERLFDHWGYLHRPEVVADIYQVLSCRPASEIPGRDRKDTHRYAMLAR
jgi:esterase/lipase superfamily enzyme